MPWSPPCRSPDVAASDGQRAVGAARASGPRAAASCRAMISFRSPDPRSALGRVPPPPCAAYVSLPCAPRGDPADVPVPMRAHAPRSQQRRQPSAPPSAHAIPHPPACAIAARGSDPDGRHATRRLRASSAPPTSSGRPRTIRPPGGEPPPPTARPHARAPLDAAEIDAGVISPPATGLAAAVAARAEVPLRRARVRVRRGCSLARQRNIRGRAALARTIAAKAQAPHYRRARRRVRSSPPLCAPISPARCLASANHARTHDRAPAEAESPCDPARAPDPAQNAERFPHARPQALRRHAANACSLPSARHGPSRARRGQLPHFPTPPAHLTACNEWPGVRRNWPRADRAPWRFSSPRAVGECGGSRRRVDGHSALREWRWAASEHASGGPHRLFVLLSG